MGPTFVAPALGGLPVRLGLKIGHKLPLLMALITIAALYLAELITTTNARATILAAGEDRLLAVASSRAAEVQGVLASVRADIRAKANNPVILEAARAFQRSWDREGPMAAERLRAAYIAGRDRPVGGELSAPRPNVNAGYHRTHSFYHPFFSNHAASRDYADLYLVSPTGQVVYSVAKGDSFGATLSATLDAGDGLSLVFDRVVNGNGFAVDIMTDFEPYGASPSKRSAFFAVPIRDGLAQLQGVLIIRLPAAVLAEIVGRSDGLGRTGRATVLAWRALGPRMKSRIWPRAYRLSFRASASWLLRFSGAVKSWPRLRVCDGKACRTASRHWRWSALWA